MARVLVIDDEDSLLAMVAELLDDLGHQPLLATNGYEALELLRGGVQPPALVIADVMMPRMNGIALAEAIKKDPRLQSIPIILMSAAGRPAGSQVAEQFLAKPFDLNVLARLIERLT